METGKIEFYKSRSVGEVLSAAADFLRQNWKILYKNILIIGAPLAVLQGIFLNNYSAAAKTVALGAGNVVEFGLNTLLFFVIAAVLSLFVYSITATMINRYGEGALTENTKWGDLKDSVYDFAGKTFVIGLILILVIVVLAFVVGIISFGLGSASSIGAGIFKLIIFGLVIAFLPGLTLTFFPAYYSDYSAWDSFKTGISLGLRHWGSTFLVLLVAGIIAAVFSIILAGGYQIWSLLSITLQLGVVGTIIAYVLAIVASFATLLATPITIVFLSFQYFSIVEKEDGISVQSGIDEFDNL
ncbi:hypothetical protein AGMMS50262_11370 [Bacteroidia bacterium]|nr:hypothetical protein AGMMS50262_11370 [Bacteroidia bacterium]